LASNVAPVDIWKEVDTIKGEMDAVAESNPNASGRIWDRTRRHLKGQFSRRERLLARVQGLPLVPIGQPSDPDGPRELILESDSVS
jgi:hypothetical protein